MQENLHLKATAQEEWENGLFNVNSMEKNDQG